MLDINSLEIPEADKEILKNLFSNPVVCEKKIENGITKITTKNQNQIVEFGIKSGKIHGEMIITEGDKIIKKNFVEGKEKS